MGGPIALGWVCPDTFPDRKRFHLTSKITESGATPGEAMLDASWQRG
jgi:hypothetical protein